MSVDHSAMKLGLLPPKPSLLARLPGMDSLGVPLPTAAPEIDWSRAVARRAWGMDMNDRLGCCTIADIVHAIILSRTNAGLTWTVATDEEVIAAYIEVSGYDPRQTDANGDNPTDTGAVWTDVLLRWQRTGFLLGNARHQASAFVRVNPSDENEMRLAVQWFGCVHVGIDLPLSAQTQDIWEVMPGPNGEPGTWGRHAIPLVGYDAKCWKCITWGAPKLMTRAFGKECIDEAYAALLPDWLEKSGASPAGMTIDALRTDLTEIGNV